MTRASTKLVVAALVATIAACGGSTAPVAGILKVKTIAVADISKVGQYSATVQQVAASSTFALRSLTNYSLSVTQ